MHSRCLGVQCLGTTIFVHVPGVPSLHYDSVGLDSKGSDWPLDVGVSFTSLGGVRCNEFNVMGSMPWRPIQ